MAQIYHKRGDTLSLSFVWKDSTGTPIDLTGYTLASQVKVISRTTTFTDTLTVTVTDAVNGSFSLNATATATSSWPVTDGAFSKMFCDIQFTLGSVVISSDTFQIIVVEDITQ